MKVRLLSDLGKGDTVRTASGRIATVKGFEGDGVVLLDQWGEELTLLPHHLELLAKAPPHAFPLAFFPGGVDKAMAR